MSCCYTLPPPDAYSAWWKTPKCDMATPNWNYDAHRAYFCGKFGRDQPQHCLERIDTCESIHKPLRSLDHYTAPPLYRRNACASKFRYHKSDIDYNPCMSVCKESYTCCPGIPQLPECLCRPKPRPFGDAVCGLCKVNECYGTREDDCGEEKSTNNITHTCNWGEMPFTVHVTEAKDWEIPQPPKPNSEAERCLHPNNIRELKSVYNDVYLDFHKLKSPKDISLYRTQLAIDSRRPGPKIPVEDPENEPIDVSKPIYIMAKPIRMKRRGKAAAKTVEICVTGPITIG